MHFFIITASLTVCIVVCMTLVLLGRNTQQWSVCATHCVNAPLVALTLSRTSAYGHTTRTAINLQMKLRGTKHCAPGTQVYVHPALSSRFNRPLKVNATTTHRKNALCTGHTLALHKTTPAALYSTQDDVAAIATASPAWAIPTMLPTFVRVFGSLSRRKLCTMWKGRAKSLGRKPARKPRSRSPQQQPHTS